MDVLSPIYQWTICLICVQWFIKMGDSYLHWISHISFSLTYWGTAYIFIGMRNNRYEPSFGELYDKAIIYLIKFLCKMEFKRMNELLHWMVDIFMNGSLRVSAFKWHAGRYLPNYALIRYQMKTTDFKSCVPASEI